MTPRILALAISALLLSACSPKPSNLEDCIWQASKAPSSDGAVLAGRYCYKKFRAEADALDK